MPSKDPFDHVVDCPGHYLHGAHVAIIGPCINTPSAVWVESQRGSIDWVYRNQAKPIPQPVTVKVAVNPAFMAHLIDGGFSHFNFMGYNVYLGTDDRHVIPDGITIGELTITPEQIEAARKAVADAK